MSPEEQVRDHLLNAWLASLDEDPDTWHESPWAHIVFLIGQQMDEHEPTLLDSLLERKLA